MKIIHPVNHLLQW